MGAEKQNTKILVYDFLDYREYLRAWYLHSKNKMYGFSYRVFSRQAGFKSSNILKLVLDGDRNLSASSVDKFAKGLGIDGEEYKYFRLLVSYNQAKCHEEKNKFHQKILRCRHYRTIRSLGEDEYEFYGTWYHPIVRELLICKYFDGSPDWIVQRTTPSLSLQQVEASIALLERLKLVAKIKTKDGFFWKQTNSLITTGPKPVDPITLKFHQDLLMIVREQLPKIQQECRDVSALVLGVNRSEIPSLKKMIQNFRRDVLKFVSVEENPEEVLVLSMQLLPFSKL